jgi:cell division protein FtsI (penicillin-binding protein 3)
MAALTVVAFGAIAVRLVQVQAVDADRFAAFGESQLLHTVTLRTSRGAIFDRNGRDLALTINRPTIWANPRLVTDPFAEAAALAPVLGVEEASLVERLRRDAAFVYLARRVDEVIAQRVEALQLDGVFLLEGGEPMRFNPAGDLAAPVLGIVGIDNTGLGGLELKYESVLAGTPGRMVVERDPTGDDIPGGVREMQPATPGDDLVLTIDRALQYEAERALASAIVTHGAAGGTAVVMESATGELLAMADLVAGPEGEPPRPASSATAFTHVHEPGSVNKMISVAAALEEGLVRPDDKLTIPYTIQIADKTFKEHDFHPTEDWSVTDIVANSSNVGAIMIGQELGKDRLDSYLRRFGFGSRTALGFPGESAGIMLDPDKWSGTSIGTIPIGQGIAVTAVQMLAAYNTIANGGVYVAPKLVRGTVGSDGTMVPAPASETRRVVSERTAAQMTGMLTEVVRRGTGINAAIDGYTVAGKTGTARKPRRDARGYEPGAYVSTFAGFVPAERPALTAIVMLDEPKGVIYGGTVAAPAFASMTRYGLRQFRVPPVAPGASVLPTTSTLDRQTPAPAEG